MSALLHDSWCSWSDEDLFNSAEGTLTISVERIRYEAPQHKRVLGLSLLTRFQIVPAELVVTDVRVVSLTPEYARNRYYPFSFVEQEDMNLHLNFEGAAIAAQLGSWAPIVLRDVGEPSPKSRHTFFGNWRDGVAA